MRTTLSFAAILLILTSMESCSKDGTGGRTPCDEKGGPLSTEERSWFAKPGGYSAQYRLEGSSTTMTQEVGPLVVVNKMGDFEREEHCQWGYEAGSQLFGHIAFLEVEHCGVGTEDYATSARFYGHHFSDYTPQNGVVVNGVAYDGAYVIPGNPSHMHDIIFSKAHGLIAFTSGGERWLLEP